LEPVPGLVETDLLGHLPAIPMQVVVVVAIFKDLPELRAAPEAVVLAEDLLIQLIKLVRLALLVLAVVVAVAAAAARQDRPLAGRV
jgi:hypothetical protein